MLGLGDIVIPGILIALMLRLDDNVKELYSLTLSLHINLAQIRQQKIFPRNLFRIYCWPSRYYLCHACLEARSGTL